MGQFNIGQFEDEELIAPDTIQPGIYIRGNIDGWPDEDLDKLRELAQTRDTFSQVADEFPGYFRGDVADAILYCFGINLLEHLIDQDSDKVII